MLVISSVFQKCFYSQPKHFVRLTMPEAKGKHKSAYRFKRLVRQIIADKGKKLPLFARQ